MIETPKKQINFIAYVRPEPQGSAKAFMRPGSKFPVVTCDNEKMKPCRSEITRIALIAASPHAVPIADKHVPVSILIDFYLRKPTSVPKKRSMPTVKPDIDKLVRMVLDGLTGVIYKDDSQVVEVMARKHYDGIERIEISATFL